MTPLLRHVPPQLPVGPCKIAFVGSHPTEHDRLHGLPLCGPEGRTFDQMLRIAGLAVTGEDYPVPPLAKRVGKLVRARAPFLLTNVFDEVPPGGEIGAWFASAPEAKRDGYNTLPLASKGYLRPAHGHHLVRLQCELEAAKPNLIVPLGPVGLWVLTGLCDITLARGAVTKASLLVPGTKLLPTFAPVHIQKEWRLFHVTVTDLVKAAREAEFPEVRLVKRKIHIRPTLTDLSRWEQFLMAAPRLAVDIETAKQQITCIGFAPDAASAYVIPFVDYEKPSRSYWSDAASEKAAWQTVRKVCEGPAEKVMQNGLYDCYYLARQAGIFPRNYCEDTRMQHHALYPELPKSLAFMGATYADAGPWKTLNVHKREDKRDA